MSKLDIIILSNTADKDFHNLLSITVNSIKKQTEVDSNIILVETNKEYKTKEQYDLPIDVLVVPSEPFHFNKFLNHGLKHSTAEYIVFSNNDVRYYPNSLAEMVKGLQTFDSVCPFANLYSEECNRNKTLEQTNLENWKDINRTFFGFCYAFNRHALNKYFQGFFDETFVFFCQDNDIINTLATKKARHALMGRAVIDHLNKQEGIRRYNSHGESYHLLGSGSTEDIHFYTQHQFSILKSKWPTL